MPKASKHKPFYRKKAFLWPVGLVIGLVVAALVAFRVSPWPGAMVIRIVFNRGGHKTLETMEAKLPKYPVTVLANQQYRAHDKAAQLDVYMPNNIVNTQTALPVVVWTHGGAWLSGNKSDDAPYFARLADQGFVVIGLNYALAPEKTYPYAVHQINDAYAYIQANAARFHANTNRLFLGGDSAGAQLSGQLAALITNPDYAKEVGVRPNLTPSQLVGVVLFCGIYKMEGLTQSDPTLPKIVGWGDDVTVWAYSGTADKSSPLIRQMSPYYHVAAAFPSTFISGGNGDPLTDAQSRPLAEKLAALKVPVTSLFYAKNHQPSLPHEYQFTFNDDGEKAFAATAQFLKAKAAE
ncbi:MAG TPA: alpha/beta hydrolase [Candidatus Saccharimonadales bacterium]|nr:alpha/beta hydrolase [Candidatus Saccharimonadales bacterium]